MDYITYVQLMDQQSLYGGIKDDAAFCLIMSQTYTDGATTCYECKNTRQECFWI